MGEQNKIGVLVLGGGPDAEREVSLRSAGAVAAALGRDGRFEVHARTIDRLSADELRGMPGDVVFPVLHGRWGEGGPLQDVLESDGRAFVGCGSSAARHAMDKVASKLTAAGCGIPTAPAFVLDVRDTVCPLAFPVVVKPVHEGSTVGLHVCRSCEQWAHALVAIERDRVGTFEGERRVYMVEGMVTGADGVGAAREFTVAVIDGRACGPLEIAPAAGLYDYAAKYERGDTRYIRDPELPAGLRDVLMGWTERLFDAMGCRHVARADYMVDGHGRAWFLELNTMPGFTATSLTPMAAEHSMGLGFDGLCARLVELALRDANGGV